jgi:lipid II:glycine glycyltransferase (peptidoglycan interpeptide bridge formation enzyme)
MFSFEFISADDNLSSAENIITNRFLQSPFWAAFKSQHGWFSKRYTLKALCNNTSFSFQVSVLIRSFKKIFSLAYIPMGVDLEQSGIVLEAHQYMNFLAELGKYLVPFLPKNTLCIRIDPPLDFSTVEERSDFLNSLQNNKNIIKSIVDIQPPDTTILDLSLSEDDLLANMKQKWRYNIRLAEKKGVNIKKYHYDNIDIFYSLYEETAKRDGIAIHSKKYYSDLLQLSDSKTTVDTPLVQLFVAEHEGDNIASIITLFSKREAVYLYGASSNNKRNLMPAYLLQWSAIKEAKKYGSIEYDFYGMPPTDDETHPMHGLYRFKTGFGGRIVHRAGSFDIPINKVYKFFVFAEKIRAFFFKKIKKILAGR